MIPVTTLLGLGGTVAFAAFIVTSGLLDAGAAPGGGRGAPPAGCDYSGTSRTGTNGPDAMIGTPFRDLLNGIGGDDTIEGRGCPDELLGGPGNDNISGGEGNDVLVGGPGNDQLTGGPGADQFNCGPGTDTVVDFNPAEGDRTADRTCENV